MCGCLISTYIRDRGKVGEWRRGGGESGTVSGQFYHLGVKGVCQLLGSQTCEFPMPDCWYHDTGRPVSVDQRGGNPEMSSVIESWGVVWKL